MKNTLLTILSLSIATVPMSAVEKSDSVRFLFRQGRSELDSNQENNQTEIRMLDSLLNRPDVRINNIRIIGSASPEGPVNLNYTLSNQRAEKILDLFTDSRFTENRQVEIVFLGRDWKELYKVAQADENIPFRDETVSLLSEFVSELGSNPIEKESDHYLERLKALKGGIPFQYLYANVFPYLRASSVSVTYSMLPQPDLTIIGPEIHPSGLSLFTEPVFFPSAGPSRESKNFYMALKSNMLYDVMALPSLSAEFYLGRNFSVAANWTYGWWDTDRKHRYWRAYGGDLAARWWFGKKAKEKPLTGHHIGIYGGILTYDFEFGGTGYMGGLPHETLWNRSLRMAGIEYGYSLPIARRLNIDFTIGIGYLGGKYIKYIPDGGRYLWQSTHKINWFGPTKAEISLVWLIGNGNYNSHKKGGKK